MTGQQTVAVIADVHGNLHALEAALRDAQERGASQVWAAGDLTLGGAYPLQTFNRLRETGARMIRGNSEQYLEDYAAGRFPVAARTTQQWAPLRWTFREMSTTGLAELKALPQQAVFTANGAAPARVVHGSPRRINEGLIPESLPEVVTHFQNAQGMPHQASNTFLREVLPGVAEPVFICGHTHIAWVWYADGRLALNPGSLGAPINGDRRAQYALLHWDGMRWQAELRAVAYDLAQVRSAYNSTGWLEEGGVFARAFLLNNETGVNVAWFWVVHLVNLAKSLGMDITDGFPDDLWFEGERTFDWKYYENLR